MKKSIIKSLINVSHVKVHDNILSLHFPYAIIVSMEYKLGSFEKFRPFGNNLRDTEYLMRKSNIKQLNKAIYSVLDTLSINTEFYRYCVGRNNLICMTNKQVNGVVVYYMRHDTIFKWIVEAGQNILRHLPHSILIYLPDTYNTVLYNVSAENGSRMMADDAVKYNKWDLE